MIPKYEIEIAKVFRAAGFDCKKLASGRGSEGHSLVGDLLFKGKLVGEIADYGDGGSVYARWWDAEARQAFEEASARAEVTEQLKIKHKEWTKGEEMTREEQRALEARLGSSLGDEWICGALLNYFEARRVSKRAEGKKVIYFDPALTTDDLCKGGKVWERTGDLSNMDAVRADIVKRRPGVVLLADVVAEVEALAPAIAPVKKARKSAAAKAVGA